MLNAISLAITKTIYEINIFAIGPASEVKTSAVLAFTLRHLEILNSIGFDQPMGAISIISAPNNSICAKGFRVSLPCLSGVSSPRNFAVSPRAYSRNGKTTKIITPTEKQEIRSAIAFAWLGLAIQSKSLKTGR